MTTYAETAYAMPLKEMAASLASQDGIDQEAFLNLVGFTLTADELREVLEQIAPPRSPAIRERVMRSILDRIELYDPRPIVEDWLAATPRHFLSIDDLRAMPAPEFLYEDMIQERGLHLLAGAYGSFKTFLALNIAIGVASRGRRVVYFLNEGQDVVKPRWDARVRYLGIPDPEVAFDIETRHLLEDAVEIVRRIKEQYGGADLLIFDTLRRSTVGLDEDRSGDFARIVGACDYIRRETGAAIILVDHTGHDKSRVRGTSAKYDSVDVALLVEREEGTPYALLKCQKMKGASEWSPRPYHLVTDDGPVLLPTGEKRPRDPRRSRLGAAFGTEEFTTADAARLLDITPAKARDLLNAMPAASLVSPTVHRWRLEATETAAA